VHGMDSVKLWELNCSARNGQCKIVGVPRYFGMETLHMVRNYVRK